MTGDEHLREAARLRGEEGMAYLARLVDTDGRAVMNVVQMAHAYRDPVTGRYREDTPPEIITFCRFIRDHLREG